MHRGIVSFCALLCALFASEPVIAHDPSAYGGLFRSRDYGNSWLNADVGLFLGAVLSLAIDPVAPDHLLLGTDTGLLRSRNGGRNWAREVPGELFGAVFSVTFLPGGKASLCSTPAAVFRFSEDRWERASAPADAVPSRVIVFGAAPGRAYLVGRRELFQSEDDGRTWVRIRPDLPEHAQFTELVLARTADELLIAIIDGRVMTSIDQGRHWSARTSGLTSPGAEGLSLDPLVPGRVWVGSADRVYVADTTTFQWRAVGAPLPDAGTSIRGIAARPDGQGIIAATHRGLYRSSNGGKGWALVEDNLPVHLDSRPLVNDPSRAGTFYAGFSLMPYAEIWRISIEGGNLLARVDPVSIAGGIAFLMAVALVGVLATRWLLRRASSRLAQVMERQE